jgi:TfoX/Sxy family transcriptional regulator of competence genes
MAYDETLAQRVRDILKQKEGINEIEMFGGIGFLFNGNMVCGILNNDLIIRIGPQKYEQYLEHPHTRKFNITGRAMRGWLMISDRKLTSEKDLLDWVQQGLDFASSLPSK